MKDFLVTCWGKKDSRNMLIFFTINMIFMFVELGYGVYSNSLGLISDAFHMLSDNISLIVALIATYISMSKEAD
jgi:zinc transporter 5/7